MKESSYKVTSDKGTKYTEVIELLKLYMAPKDLCFLIMMHFIKILMEVIQVRCPPGL